MKAKIYLLSLLAVFFSSCDGYFSGMDIKNEYTPGIDAVMSDANQYPSLLSGVCTSYWSCLLGSDTWMWPMATNADQYTPGAGNWDMKAYTYYDGQEKPEIDNSTESAEFPKNMWYSYYAMINTVKNVLVGINNGAVYTEAGQETNYKILANAYFLMGMCYTEMCLLFDQAFILTEETDVQSITAEDLRPASEVQAKALWYLDECIKICNEKGNFTNLTGMFPNNTMATGDQLKQLANFMAARCLAYFPRTKAETANVNWEKVKGYAKDALQEDIKATLPNNDYGQWTMIQNAGKEGGWARISMRILEMMCPDDPNAVWPLPKDFDATSTLPELQTADQRLKTDFEYTPSPAASGTTFSGYQYYSPYSMNRFNDYRHNGEGDMYLFTKTESDLLYAEALLNTNGAAAAADIINVTRVGRGGLPAATAADDLTRALYYERFVECDFVYPATSLFDRRRTPIDEFQITTRSFRQLPVPVIELKAFGLETYTFGGEQDANPNYKF